ncbi:DUF502 domain-containing protein [Halobacteriales archaeon Cl-PHB]
MARPDVGESADRAREAGKSLYRSIIDVILTGIVVIVPLVITLFVLQAAFNFIANALRPFIQVLRWAGLIESVKSLGFVDFLITVGIYSNVVEFITTITALFILLLIIVSVGLLARVRYGEQLIDFFDALIGSIPAVGSIYGSFRRMGDAMLESSVDNFQEVVLVEYPDEDLYLLGFKTNDTPMPIVEAADESSMTTLFLPLAPNPVMGGFLAHIPDEKVRSVDMTVEDAVRIIITSGIATQSPDSGRYRALNDEERKQISELVSIRDTGDAEDEA